MLCLHVLTDGLFMIWYIALHKFDVFFTITFSGSPCFCMRSYLTINTPVFAVLYNLLICKVLPVLCV